MKKKKEIIDIIKDLPTNKKKLAKKVKGLIPKHDILHSFIGSVEETRGKINSIQKPPLTPHQKRIILQKMKVGSHKQKQKEVMEVMDKLISKPEKFDKGKLEELKAFRKKVGNIKLRKLNPQTREIASKLLISITHGTNKKSSTKTVKRREKLSDNKTKQTKKKTRRRKVQGGSVADALMTVASSSSSSSSSSPGFIDTYVEDVIQWLFDGLADIVTWVFDFIVGIYLWVPYAGVVVVGYVLFFLVDAFQTIIGITPMSYTGLTDWLVPNKGTLGFGTPFEWMETVPNWPKELSDDLTMITTGVDTYIGTEANEIATGADTYIIDPLVTGTTDVYDEITTGADTYIIDPLVTGTTNVYGEITNSFSSSIDSLSDIKTTYEPAILTGDVVLETGVEAATTNRRGMIPSNIQICMLCLKVVTGYGLLGALLTSLPSYLINKRTEIQSAYDNISKYGWLIALFPLEIEPDSNFYCEKEIDIVKERERIDLLFDDKNIINNPSTLTKIIDKLEINGRNLQEFQEVVYEDIHDININLFNNKDKFADDFEKFRKQINIAKNIDFTRSMILSRKRIIESSEQIVLAIETMTKNNSKNDNINYIRLLIDNIRKLVKETITEGYEYCKKKSGQDNSKEIKKETETKETETKEPETKPAKVSKNSTRKSTSPDKK